MRYPPKSKNHPLRIGIDFDGVIADPTREKIAFAKKYLGVDLRPENCTTRKAEKLYGKAYAHLLLPSLEYGPAITQFKPTPSCAKALTSLIDQGHYLVIITTLGKEKLPFAKQFLSKHGIPYSHWASIDPEVVGKESQEYGNKQYICERLNMQVMVDDDIRNLKPMSRSGKLLLLFDQPWNRDMAPAGDIFRVYGWEEALDKIKGYQKNMN